MEPGLESTTPETAAVEVKTRDFAISKSSSIDSEVHDKATESETSEILEREEPTMRRPITIHWDLPISESDYNLFKTGFTPQSMEDRWVIESAHVEGISAYSVCFARSWTGNPYHVLIVKGQGPVIDSLIYESLTEGGDEITEETAKEHVIALARGWLECEIAAFPRIDNDPPFYQVDANGTIESDESFSGSEPEST